MEKIKKEPEITAKNEDITEINSEKVGRISHFKKKKKKPHIDPFAVDETEPLEKRSFARGLNFYKLFWIFFIGSFIGVVIEVIFCILVTEHHYECRQGLIYGPFNPVYGFGAVAMTLALYYFRNKRDLWIYVGGSVVGASFEYLCSFVQEKFLGTVSWDYSGMIGNIGGRTCLFFAVIWGFLALAWLKIIYPFVSKIIEKIPNKIGIIVSWILLVFMVFDCAVSALAVYRMTQRHNDVPATTSYQQFMDEHYPDSFMYQIYPNMLDTHSKPEKGD